LRPWFRQIERVIRGWRDLEPTWQFFSRSDSERQETESSSAAGEATKDLMRLPEPLADPEQDRSWELLSRQIQERCECLLDDTCAVNVPRPKTKQEENDGSHRAGEYCQLPCLAVGGQEGME
jgi:hypothetical protein